MCFIMKKNPTATVNLSSGQGSRTCGNPCSTAQFGYFSSISEPSHRSPLAEASRPRLEASMDPSKSECGASPHCHLQ